MKKKFTKILTVIVIIIVIIFIIVMLMGGTNIHFHTKAKKGQIKVACVGDSITYGIAIPNVFYNSYPAQLGRMLGDSYHVENYGYSGKTVLDSNPNSYRRTKEYSYSQAYQPNIVIIMLGTNDTKPENWTSQEDFKEQYRTLIQSYVDLDSKPRVILCTPNSAYYVYGKTKGNYSYGINGENLPLVYEAVKQLANEMELELIDFYQVTSGHSEWYKFDGIHPNITGAKVIARAIKDLIS